MVEDGEDWHGFKLKSLAKLFIPFNRDWAPLIGTGKVGHQAAGAVSLVSVVWSVFLSLPPWLGAISLQGYPPALNVSVPIYMYTPGW